jgi:hypothetical protein
VLFEKSNSINSTNFITLLQPRSSALDSPDNNASGGQEPFCKRVPGPPKTFYQVLFLPYLLALRRVSSRFTKMGGGTAWLPSDGKTGETGDGALLFYVL